MPAEIFKVRITGANGAYKVSAQLRNDERDADLGPLPENLKQQLRPLQESILYTTLRLPTRLPAVTLSKVATSTTPQNGPAAPDDPTARLPQRGAAADFIAGADIKNIQAIGSKLFNCLFQQDVYALYSNA